MFVHLFYIKRSFHCTSITVTLYENGSILILVVNELFLRCSVVVFNHCGGIREVVYIVCNAAGLFVVIINKRFNTNQQTLFVRVVLKGNKRNFCPRDANLLFFSVLSYTFNSEIGREHTLFFVDNKSTV